MTAKVEPSERAVLTAQRVRELFVQADRFHCMCFNCHDDERCEGFRERRAAFKAAALALDAFAAEARRQENEACEVVARRVTAKCQAPLGECCNEGGAIQDAIRARREPKP